MASSRGFGFTLGAIAVANGGLLAGLFWLGWSPATVAFLFWFEAALIGAFTLLKVAASLPGYVPRTTSHAVYVRPPRPGGAASVRSAVPSVGPGAVIPVFLVLYGLLLALYATLLLHAVKARDLRALVDTAIGSRGVQVAMAAFVAEHALAFWREFIRGPAWMRADPVFHLWKPFGLFFVVWLAFALGFLVFGWLDSPLVVLVVLVVLKVIAEAFNALIDANAGPWEQAGEE